MLIFPFYILCFCCFFFVAIEGDLLIEIDHPAVASLIYPSRLHGSAGQAPFLRTGGESLQKTAHRDFDEPLQFLQ
jgi:hypothetical protein